MTTSLNVLLALCISCLLTSCSQQNEETPQEGLEAIIDLYETKNITKLVNERYTEIHKFKNEEDKQEVINKITKYISNEKKYEEMILFFKSVQNTEPNFSQTDPKWVQPTETGESANFKGKPGQTYTLYEMKNGLWGFRM
ncbi:hypothetical protein LNTAR_19372 [Lentisphaera araneosa HTCC2155]|uniref:DUF5104 domain-containing protein n=1 Tax=Lentisphaera araneosa HTCC2155 TaxID=313628 RepID=A6DQU0_9BACT|nr:hypothetical protein [Lentisphaera araneosa]EDM25990.1 hypothetical protein LNTAR_19372 [Lentisphaera araneosa HTCC2155]